MNAFDEKLKEFGVTKLNVFPGPKATPEKIEEQVLSMLEALKTGEDVEIILPLDEFNSFVGMLDRDPAEKPNLRRLLAE